MSVIERPLEQPVRSPRATGRLRRFLLPLVVAVAMVVGVLLLRGWRPSSSPATNDPAPVAAGMPASAQVEDSFGVRLASVAVTAGNGMVQIRYQVLDPTKAGGLHDEANSPVIIRADGTLFDAPGIPGHAHGKNTPEAGRAGYVLLANTKGGIRPGMIVTVRVGDVLVKGVPVL